MDQQTRKKIIVFSCFGLFILGVIVYGFMVFGNKPKGDAWTSSNDKRKVSRQPIDAAYENKVRAYQKDRTKQIKKKTTSDPSFLGTSAFDSISPARNQPSDKRIIDSLKQIIAQLRQESDQTTGQSKRVSRPAKAGKGRAVQASSTPVPVADKKVMEETPGNPFASLNLDRKVNPLDEFSLSDQGTTARQDQEQEEQVLFFAGKFVENTLIRVGEDQSVAIRNTETITLPGIAIPKNTLMKAQLSTLSNRLLLRVYKVETIDGVIHQQFSVYHDDNLEGLPLSASNQLATETRNKLSQAANSIGARAQVTLPIVNTPITLAPRVGNRQQKQIYVPASMTFKLKAR